MIVFPQTAIGPNGDTIVRMAVQHRLPTIYGNRDIVMAGGLMCYGPDPADQSRRAATCVGHLLRGAKVSELPVQFPTKFELVVNLKIAKAVGLTIPEAFLLRALEVDGECCSGSDWRRERNWDPTWVSLDVLRRRAGNEQTDCNRPGQPPRLNVEIGSEISSPEMGSTPGQVVVTEGQVAITLPGDLEDGIGNARLNRGAAVVTHATQPMPGLEEGDVDFWRILLDARQQECVKVVLRNAAFRDVALLMHRVVVEPGNLAFDLFPNR
jgi:ABC transporter substrate binding protein